MLLQMRRMQRPQIMWRLGSTGVEKQFVALAVVLKVQVVCKQGWELGRHTRHWSIAPSANVCCQVQPAVTHC